MIIWRLRVQSLVVFNFCALNQTTKSAQVCVKWISARTPHGVRAESVDCAQSARTGCGLHRTPHSPHRTGSDPWGSVNYCILLINHKSMPWSLQSNWIESRAALSNLSPQSTHQFLPNFLGALNSTFVSHPPYKLDLDLVCLGWWWSGVLLSFVTEVSLLHSHSNPPSWAIMTMESGEKSGYVKFSCTPVLIYLWWDFSDKEWWAGVGCHCGGYWPFWSA